MKKLKKINLHTVCEPSNFKDLLERIGKNIDMCKQEVYIAETLTMNTKDYDHLLQNFISENDKIAGKGGQEPDGLGRFIKIMCPNRMTIYVNPEGYNYARYVGILIK